MEANIEIKKATDSIYKKVSKTIPEIEWAIHAPYIYKINKLKKEKINTAFKKTVKAAKTKEGLGTIGGATVGGYIGSSIGIAALGTAVAGTLPVAAVGAGVGYLAVKAYKKKK